jgi:DNA-binding response OmpR family regulator
MRVLLIERHPTRRGALERMLGGHGHHARAATSGMDGLHQAMADPFDVILLDLELPDVRGPVVLKMLRAFSDVAVIATASSHESMDEIMDAGADDFLVKPYTAEQLLARLRIVGARVEAAAAPGRAIQVGALHIDQAARVAHLGGHELALARKEFDLLAYLAGKAGQVVSKRELAAKVWSDPYGASDRTVNVHLSWLRHKLGESAAAPRFLRTVRGVGIKLIDPG